MSVVAYVLFVSGKSAPGTLGHNFSTGLKNGSYSRKGRLSPACPKGTAFLWREEFFRRVEKTGDSYTSCLGLIHSG